MSRSKDQATLLIHNKFDSDSRYSLTSACENGHYFYCLSLIKYIRESYPMVQIVLGMGGFVMHTGLQYQGDDVEGF